MSSVVEPTPRGWGAWLDWVPVALGLLVLYVPTFYDLAGTLWREEDHAHGPIILAIVVWLLWRQRDRLRGGAHVPARVSGVAVLVFGLALYVVGRSQDINVFQIGALIPVLLGTVLAMRGWAVARALWFPLLFSVFLIPFPSVFVDAVTGPLKQAVSFVAERVLHAAGYPIGRTGVVLTVAQYQLLVADACSGLNSMLSLSALGLLYLYLVRRDSVVHNALIVAAILPIAFAANIVRVIVLILITYHFGDEAGQSFLHGAAGIVLVLAALLLLLAIDGVLARVIPAVRRR